MIDNRRYIYKTFKDLYQHKDLRTAEEICKEGVFKLQVQQQFFKAFVQKHPNFRPLLLYHAIGSGKTISSIALSEEYMKMRPNTKVLVILPARLRSNYYGELVSECTKGKYLSAEDKAILDSDKTSNSEKKKINKKVAAAIAENYEIMSFEKLRKLFIVNKNNIKKFVNEFTENRVIIIDEVHNLINTNYKSEEYKSMIDTGVLDEKFSGILTLMLKALTYFRNTSCRMAFLTATPIVNNIQQFVELVRIMNPKLVLGDKSTFGQIVNTLRGRVSYFPGVSKAAYPSVKETTETVEVSPLQEQFLLKTILPDDEILLKKMNEQRNAFMSHERQVELSIYGFQKRFKIKIPDSTKLGDAAPKIKAALHNILTLPGKHVVYSSFIQVGLRVLERVLKRHGYTNILDKNVEHKPYKSYALWDGKSSDEDKTKIKKIVNDVQNIAGKNLRVVLGSPSIKEGVSLKHIQHMHILDPLWNYSNLDQVKGRTIRYCSHIEIPKDHPKLKRQVEVHIYKLVPRKDGEIMKTADTIIYDQLIPEKYEPVHRAEEALKKVAMDYHLFRNMYKDNSSPIAADNIDVSPLNLENEDQKLSTLTKGNKKTKNKCPKPRRPPCALDYIMKLNKHENECCYKIKKTKTK